MRGVVIHGPSDVRVQDRPIPQIIEPTDAIVRVVAACICGSDLWRYRGINEVDKPTPMGHEYVGVITELGDDVAREGKLHIGQFVIGGFTTSCGHCAACSIGQYVACERMTRYDGCQAQYVRVPNAPGTLVGLDQSPEREQIPHLLTLSDVMGTGWHAAVSARVEPGHTTVVVGDGAVGLCGVIAARQMGAQRVIIMSRHPQRAELAQRFGATDVIAERGAEGAAKVAELTNGLGADSVLECVGTHESVDQALQCARSGALVGWVGLPHIQQINQEHMFWRGVGIAGGIAPVRAYLPHLLDLVMEGQIEPGLVFDDQRPLEDAADGYRAMDERESIKTLLWI